MEQDYKKILVPVDGSKEAEMAFKKAVKVAQMNGGHLDVLTVLDTKQFIGLHGGMLNGDVIYQLSEDAQKYLNELKDGAVKNGFNEDDIAIHVRFGRTKDSYFSRIRRRIRKWFDYDWFNRYECRN